MIIRFPLRPDQKISWQRLVTIEIPPRNTNSEFFFTPHFYSPRKNLIANFIRVNRTLLGGAWALSKWFMIASEVSDAR